jgi:hypothetical protein
MWWLGFLVHWFHDKPLLHWLVHSCLHGFTGALNGWVNQVCYLCNLKTTFWRIPIANKCPSSCSLALPPGACLHPHFSESAWPHPLGTSLSWADCHVYPSWPGSPPRHMVQHQHKPRPWENRVTVHPRCLIMARGLSFHDRICCYMTICDSVTWF